MFRKTIVLLIFSFSFLPVWMLFLVHQDNNLYLFLGFFYSFLSPFLVQSIYKKSFVRKEKFIIFIGPVFYLMTFVYVQGIVQNTWSFWDVISPLFVGFYFFVLGVFYLKSASDFKKLFFFFFAVLLYLELVLPLYKNSEYISTKITFDDESIINPATLDTTVNIFNQWFINTERDTIQLSQNEKYYLVETWNESCLPCIKAFKDMPDFYESISKKVDFFYLYEHPKERVRNKFEKIFQFKPIGDPSRILIDIGQNLFEAMNMEGYPYFLLFNQNGTLIFWQYGYTSKTKNELQAKILNALNL